MRRVLVAGYLGLVALGFVSSVQPRVFWTMLLPLLPISIVLMGYANWRRVCPLAFFGELGRRLNRGEQRRVPKWLDTWFFVVTFSALLAMLALRLIATNGDGAWLAGLLAVLALAAFAVNRAFTGKTWCNFVCPVGFVERVYTEPRSLPTTPSSQCGRCTACKSGCPDIDAENAYWRDVQSPARRIATYAFPGLVLGFYTYYWLRAGEWEAYFDGRWTLHPVDAELAFGPGLFFAPWVPAAVAAPLALVVFAAASLALFTAVEAVVGRRVQDDERRRHLVLSLAAFSAFILFYVFAGAPTLRRIPGGVRVMAFVAPLLGTLFLVKRWTRRRESYVREKAAAKLLKNWPFDEPPPDDPSEVYGWIKAGEHQRERDVEAYAFTVREILADGLVSRDELSLLEGVRAQLGISEREHEKVLARLSEDERELFGRADDGGVEQQAQMLGYEAALAEALVRKATVAELADLRRAFGVETAAHERVMNRLKGDSGALADRARAQVGRVRGLSRDLKIIATSVRSEARTFMAYLLERERDEARDRLLDLLELVDDQDLVRSLEDELAAPLPDGADDGSGGLETALAEKAVDPDPYVRAASVWVAAGVRAAWATALVESGRADGHDLVAETARMTPSGSSGTGRDPASAGERTFADLTTIEKMNALRSVPLFAGLDPEDLHDLAGFVIEDVIEPDDVLCREGDTDADDLFVLLRGRASVRVLVPAGPGGERVEQEVAVLGPGEVVGELSILDAEPRSATVAPREGPLRVLRISGQRFRQQLLPRARVSQPLLMTLAQRIREISKRAAEGRR